MAFTVDQLEWIFERETGWPSLRIHNLTNQSYALYHRCLFVWYRVYNGKMDFDDAILEFESALRDFNGQHVNVGIIDRLKAIRSNIRMLSWADSLIDD